MVQNYYEPTIGHWYRNRELSDDIFEVVAIDNDEKLIEIQYFDGQIGELDLDTWKESRTIEVAEPEDWSGAYEVPKEDLSEYKTEVIHPENKNNPINTIESEEPDLED